MKRPWLLLAIFIISARLHAQAIVGDVSSSSDADHFSALRIRAGGLLDYRSPFEYAGLAVQTTRYSAPSYRSDASGVLLLWRRQSAATLAGSIAEAGLVRVGGRTRAIGDATWSLRPAPHTGIELIAAGDLVETRRALDRATAYTLLGASIEQQFGERLTAIALAGYQKFTDGNARVHGRGRVIWMLVPSQGLSAQIRWRQFQSNQLDVGDAYFNPGRYHEWEGVLAMRKRYAGWIWSGTLGAGQESIDGTVQHGTALAEARAEGTLGRNVHLVVHAGYNRSAGFAVADRYWYRVAGVTIIVPIR